ncbi:MAG: hypothetical protein ACREPQ_17740 [Rhodanobacter sp.]
MGLRERVVHVAFDGDQTFMLGRGDMKKQSSKLRKFLTILRPFFAICVVGLAGTALAEPASGIRYYTIAGSLPGASKSGDGVVPLASVMLPGAESTTVVTSGHKVYNNDAAIARVIKILREFQARGSAYF